ncbi:SHOCT domain-containing protein [Blautia sp. 1033sp1_1033st1_G9_1033SCRN_220408]|uniref:SHOCT domain-containing protein n=1 Tax=Blautia sp. 1033sp1_1033st1_G9_1033SCRN_220408 TaxID=3144490 RepID=UPI0034A448A5
MAYIIGVIIWGIVWGYATKAVINNKGYDDNWFWWGFFFGFIALIVALTKPENKRSQYDYNSLDSENYNYNNNYGRSSLFQDNSSSAREEGMWKCSFCGRMNNNYVGTCACGKTKNESYNSSREKTNTSFKEEKNENVNDNLEVIKKLKELLDMGAITQEEFDKKKKELL